MAEPNLNEIAFIKVSHLANGALQISGMVGDKVYAIRLLEHALDTLRSQLKEKPLIEVPNRDVDVRDYAHPVKALGDMPRQDWGDR